VSNTVVNRNWAIRLGFLVFACLATGCMPTVAARLHQEDEIWEAVFRYQFLNNASGQQKRAAVYCLSIGESADPSDEFMKRFAEYQPPVRKISECNVGGFDGVVDKNTHKRGLIFRVGSMNWISGTEVEARGGYFEGGLSASGNTYTVRKGLLGQWMVSEDKMNWISKKSGSASNS